MNVPRGRAASWLLLLVLVSGCSRNSGRTQGLPDPFEYRFAEYTQTCDGIPGHIPAHYYNETPQLRSGLCTWYMWTGGDPMRREGPPENARGNPRFWRMAERRLWKVANKLELPINVNMLSFLDSRRHDDRFQRLGAINDPGCKKATKPDVYGLWLDECEDPYSTGIMGLRLFPNPDFQPAAWDATRYLEQNANIEPPYMAGLTCGVCHIALNPANPPANPNQPQWENLVPALGNQYIREGEMFKAGLTDNSFLYWVYETQEPGTSDTSRISTDFINNPNAINAIFSILTDRPKHPETMNDGTMMAVPHVLKDGADSIGAAGAALRVFVNIGTCPDYRYSLEDSFTGLLQPQHPFDLNKAQAECVDWQLTAKRIDNAAAFLDSLKPYYLKDAPGGDSFLTTDAALLTTGKQVFAENCARCHSSKVPSGVTDKHSPQARAKWVELVMADDFLEHNFLSDDARYPLTSPDRRKAIGTNAARALGTNAATGHLWQNFSSVTFKELPSPGTLTLPNPIDPKSPINFKIPNGGYYRVPSLINVWATAPLLHNNALGRFTGDPSVKGRVDAFQDAMEQLLGLKPRPDFIKVTGKDTVLQVRSLSVRVPAGTPVNLLANINLHDLTRTSELASRLNELLKNPQRLVTLVRALRNRGQSDAELKKLVPQLLALNQSPDFIEDRGHTFGTQLSEREKRALIEFVKAF
jgi:cytochrome c5